MTTAALVNSIYDRDRFPERHGVNAYSVEVYVEFLVILQAGFVTFNYMVSQAIREGFGPVVTVKAYCSLAWYRTYAYVSVVIFHVLVVGRHRVVLMIRVDRDVGHVLLVLWDYVRARRAGHVPVAVSVLQSYGRSANFFVVTDAIASTILYDYGTGIDRSSALFFYVVYVVRRARHVYGEELRSKVARACVRQVKIVNCERWILRDELVTASPVNRARLAGF